MPINNPTNGNESQFKPTLPTDSNSATYPGKTFDLTKEQLLTFNPTYGTLFQFNPTKPIDSSPVSYSSPTFNLISEDLIYNNPTFPSANTLYTTIPYGEIISQFIPDITINSYFAGIFTQIGIEYANPTTTKVNNAYTTISTAKIERQFIPDITTLSKDNLPVYASGVYAEKNINDLISLNPTNPTGSLTKYFGVLVPSGSYSIESQFFPIYFGTGNLDTDLELRSIASKTKSGVFNIPGLNYLENIGNLPKNSSNASNIIVDRELYNPESKWAKAGAILGLNLSATGTSQYATLNLSQLYNNNPGGMSDFRARRRSKIEKLLDADFDKITLKPTSTLRINDGKASDERGGNYFKSYGNEKGGAYSNFNLTKTYGFGEQGLPGRKIRQDFTRISELHYEISNVNYKFRGDVVTAQSADKQMTYNEAANPSLANSKDPQSKIKYPDAYRDLIKFFFTGPNVKRNGGKDDVMVFRAVITSLSDTHSPQWNSQQMVGRADPNYHYAGYSRELSLDFTVYASDRDEMKPIWQKLNMLAGYTTPSYGEVAPVAPWMRITIGDLFIQQPAVINSLSYTLHDSDTTWEINIENDPWMNQLPHKVAVSIGFNLITDYLPQKGGRFYTLNEYVDDPDLFDWLNHTKKNP